MPRANSVVSLVCGRERQALGFGAGGGRQAAATRLCTHPWRNGCCKNLCRGRNFNLLPHLPCRFQWVASHQPAKSRGGARTLAETPLYFSMRGSGAAAGSTTPYTTLKLLQTPSSSPSVPSLICACVLSGVRIQKALRWQQQTARTAGTQRSPGLGQVAAGTERPKAGEQQPFRGQQAGRGGCGEPWGL